jgi:hypothetical protein
MPSFGIVTLTLNLQPSSRLQKNLTCLSRDPKLGQYLMMVGILMLLFIGFNRLWSSVPLRGHALCQRTKTRFGSNTVMYAV